MGSTIILPRDPSYYNNEVKYPSLSAGTASNLNTHPKFHGQELYAPTIHHPLAILSKCIARGLPWTCGATSHLWPQASTQVCSMPLVGILFHGPSVAYCTFCKREQPLDGQKTKLSFITSIQPVSTKWGTTNCNQPSTA